MLAFLESKSMSLWKYYHLNVMFCQLEKTTYPVVSGCQIVLSLSGSHFHPCSGKTVDALMIQLVIFSFHLYVHLKGFVVGWVSGMHCLVLVIHCIYAFRFGISVSDFPVILMFLQLVVHFPFHNFVVDAAHPLESFFGAVTQFA